MKLRRKTPAERKADRAAKRKVPRSDRAPCNPAVLKQSGSIDVPEFAIRGYYENQPFTCKDCGRAEIWTAWQQKWWYEVAKGNVWTVASRCRPCRRRERERKTEARRVHLEGLAAKGAKAQL